jgi:hypothetical protein
MYVIGMNGFRRKEEAGIEIRKLEPATRKAGKPWPLTPENQEPETRNQEAGNRKEEIGKRK